jgi:two-component system, chemotaxis family, protein-glutamate methylesterase/glutaminase
MSTRPAPQQAPATRPYQLVMIAASAGGIPALHVVLAGLPAGFSVPVLISQHMTPQHQTELDTVLERQSMLPVKLAEHGEEVKPGIVYVAPADQGLVVGPDGTFAPEDHGHRVHPAADPLFEAAAQTYGPAAIACVLTGFGEDGAKGAQAVKAHGGTVIVQDPESAQVRSMPDAALEASAADHVLPVDDIASMLCRLVEGVNP